MAILDQITLTDRDYRSLFKKSPLARIVIKTEENGDYLLADANEAAATYFDISSDRMIGQRPADLFDLSAAAQFESACRACIKTRKPVSYEALPRFRGGVKVRTFVLTPFVDASGRISLIDMLERPDASDAMQLQRERDDAIMLLTSLFDASGLGIVVTDHHGRIVRVNDSFLSEYDWTRDELVGEKFTAIIPEEDHAISVKLHAAFIARGRHGSREIKIKRKTGETADVILSTALLELSQKRRFMVSTLRDVTERNNMMRRLKRAKEEADSANRAKSAFLANMSHELRTPLNAIIGFSELMSSETFGPIGNPKYGEYIVDVHFSALHLLDIINDVLDMSKIEAGKVEIVESEVSIPEVFDSVRKIMGERAKSAQVKLDFNIAPETPNIKGDQRLIRQILINLLSNSVKFSPPETTVEVEASLLPGRLVRVSVKDSGCGISPEKINVVLEPFGQATDSKYYKSQGTGLGLPLAKAMAELHGAKLTIDSDEGKGTLVWLDFPAFRTL